MNLHEFQGKQILESYGANIQQGILAKTRSYPNILLILRDLL